MGLTDYKKLGKKRGEKKLRGWGNNTGQEKRKELINVTGQENNKLSGNKTKKEQLWPVRNRKTWMGPTTNRQ